MTPQTTRAALATVAGLIVMAGTGACAAIADDLAGAPSGVPASAERLAEPTSPSSPVPPPPPPAEPAPPEPAPAPGAGPAGDPLVSLARAALPALEIKGRAPKTGYDRGLFGQAWSDDVSAEFGRNGCDTRNDILRRDLQQITVKPGTRDCVVLSGVLHGPYTGKRINFVRGRGTSTAVQIDHVVAMSDAWQKGAQQLAPDQRREFANDPLNLLAVDGRTNQQKGASDTATWLPPNKGFRCQYVSRQVLVKERYALWVTQAERDAMDRILTSCD